MQTGWVSLAEVVGPRYVCACASWGRGRRMGSEKIVWNGAAMRQWRDEFGWKSVCFTDLSRCSQDSLEIELETSLEPLETKAEKPEDRV